MIPQFLIIIFYLVASSCSAMEPETNIDAAKMALAKQHGLIGYAIKQIGITYNEDGSVCNSPLPNLITDRIIEYIKYAIAQNLKFEKIIPNPFTMYGMPKPGDTTLSYIDFIRNKFYLSMAHNPCKPELAAGLREKIVIWDLKNNTHADLTPPSPGTSYAKTIEPGIEHLAYNPQGTQLASVSNVDYTIHIWDLTTQNIILSKKLTDSIYQLLFNHDGTKLIVGTYSKFVIWDIKTNTYQLKTVQTIPTGTVCSPDGRTIASSINTDITLWDLKSKLNETTPAEHSLNSLAFNNNGTQLVSASIHTFTERFNRLKKELQPPLTLDNDTLISQIIYCSKLNKYFILTTKNSIISIDPDKFIIDNEKQLMPTARGEQLLQSRFNKDGSKLTQIISVSRPETSHIKYYDLTPDLNSYTIEQLLAIKHQQETSSKNKDPL